jgi:ATP-dependent DNA helicase RecQ
VTPVVNAVLEIKPSGQTCIVTKTNEEALNIIGVLLREGISARQIQSSNEFNLYNLAELRAFADSIDTDDSYTVNDEVWQRAKAKLIAQYDGSDNLKGVLKLLRDFEETNNKTKYKSDFKQFIRESKLEDFISESEGTILVSTIHQTKGREFDNVFLALSRFPKMDDETKRAIYVAVTRAKKNLHILYNGNFFDEIDAENITRSLDETLYLEPSLICLQLSHKDVALGFFASCRREINSLMSGQTLSVRDEGCFWDGKQIIKFSAKFCEQIGALKAKGYVPTKATVRHIVFWQGKDCDNEVKIILPNVEFLRDEVTE